MVKIIRMTVSGIMRDIPQVTLTDSEFNWAQYAGILRHQEAMKNNRKRPDGTVATYDDDILGAIGEFIVSLAIGVPWRGPGKFRGSDLEGGFEVRTVSDPNYRLSIKSNDNNDTPHVLVRGTGDPLVWQVPGWVFPIEAKRPLYWDSSLKCWLVDQALLRPMNELLK